MSLIMTLKTGYVYIVSIIRQAIQHLALPNANAVPYSRDIFRAMRSRSCSLILVPVCCTISKTIAFAINDPSTAATAPRSLLSFDNLLVNNSTAAENSVGSSSASMAVGSYPSGRGTNDIITRGTKVTSRNGNEGGTISVTIYNNKVESSGNGNGGSAITVTINNNNTHNGLYQRFVKWWKRLWNSEASSSTSRFRH
ncbi:hypothetical protein F443_11616, partial [Phytophthora nicotianae P1569]